MSETGSFPSTQELFSFYAAVLAGRMPPVPEGKRIWRTGGQVVEENLNMPCGNLVLLSSTSRKRMSCEGNLPGGTAALSSREKAHHAGALAI
jgi:hypothetical protein